MRRRSSAEAARSEQESPAECLLFLFLTSPNGHQLKAEPAANQAHDISQMSNMARQGAALQSCIQEEKHRHWERMRPIKSYLCKL